MDIISYIIEEGLIIIPALYIIGEIIMSKENMKENEHPFLEKPDTLDPTVKNKEGLEKGGGGK